MGRQLSFLLLLLSLTLSIYASDGSQTQPEEPQHQAQGDQQVDDEAQIVFLDKRQGDQKESGMVSSMTASIRKFASSMGSEVPSSREADTGSSLDEAKSRDTDHSPDTGRVSFDASVELESLDTGRTNADNRGSSSNNNNNNNIKDLQFTGDSAKYEPQSIVAENPERSPDKDFTSTEHSNPLESKENVITLEGSDAMKERQDDASGSPFGINRKLLWWFGSSDTTSSPAPDGETDDLDPDTAFDTDEGSGDPSVTIVTFPTDDEDAGTIFVC
ncbi:hypothetical protein ElyMa_002870700 [Elysia marginata]|uniref:Uncharacterized protein n=1 Tax=Elysia marginata TaxID=1093978 RepID=A0AAV4HY37_9GAST|nr:hypothetical protein ElyMa_002870700 [Elysia marginata]